MKLIRAVTFTMNMTETPDFVTEKYSYTFCP